MPDLLSVSIVSKISSTTTGARPIDGGDARFATALIQRRVRIAVPDATAGVLQVESGLHGERRDTAGNAEFAAQRPHESGVRVGVRAAQTMVHGQDRSREGPNEPAATARSNETESAAPDTMSTTGAPAVNVAWRSVVAFAVSTSSHMVHRVLATGRRGWSARGAPLPRPLGRGPRRSIGYGGRCIEDAPDCSDLDSWC